MSICVLIVSLVTFILIRLLYGKMQAPKSTQTEKDVVELRKEILIWHRTANAMGNVSREEALVKAAIEDKIAQLREELELKEEEIMPGTRFLVVVARNKFSICLQQLSRNF